MRAALAVAGCLLLSALTALEWNDVTFAGGLDDLVRQDLATAESLAAHNDNEAALNLLLNLPNSLRTDDTHLLRIELLARMQRHRELIDIVETSGRGFQERAFSRYLGDYMLACRRQNDIGRFRDFLRSLRYAQDLRRELRLRGAVFSLLEEGRYTDADQILDLLPRQVIPPDLKGAIRAAALYYLGHTDVAGDIARHELNDGRSEREMVRAVAADILVLCALQDSSIVLPELPANLLPVTRRNLVLYHLARNELDDAEQTLLSLPVCDSTLLLQAFVAWGKGHVKTADALMTQLSPEFRTGRHSALLLQAELDYALQRYREAETDFKAYRLVVADSTLTPRERYANYAIGWAFYGYYRYNNSAYWWMKNLDETDRTPWDSLATIDLAELYTLTEHHDEAQKYYERLAGKYPRALQGDVLTHYLDNMRRTGRYDALEREFRRLYDEMEPGQRARFARALGDFFYDSGRWAASRDFYRLIPQDAADDRVVFRRERCTLLLSDERDNIAFLRGFLESYPRNRYAVSAAWDLMRYHLEAREYEAVLALRVPAVASPDTAAYYRARALQGLGRREEALVLVEGLVESASSRHMRLQAVDALAELSAGDDLTTISLRFAALADSTLDPQVHERLLKTLAKRYEQRSLYREANELYFSLMEDPAYDDSGDVRLLLANNLLRMKRYDAVQTTLQPVLNSLTHTHREQALYIDYLAALAAEKPARARAYLIDLYVAYPNGRYRNETMMGLADLYNQSGMPLLAWNFYMLVLPHVGVERKAQVEQRIAVLRETLGSGVKGLHQPMGLGPLLLQTESLLRK